MKFYRKFIRAVRLTLQYPGSSDKEQQIDECPHESGRPRDGHCRKVVLLAPIAAAVPRPEEGGQIAQPGVVGHDEAPEAGGHVGGGGPAAADQTAQPDCHEGQQA